ncbi:MAG TPA: asparaginase [Gemmatimonadaceae bacterium]|nr:asparaginase [Gemmatimonadaceae bacterium]
MIQFELDVVATRGGMCESRHRVHAAVVDAAGRLRSGAGNPRLITCWRSCAKPFQSIPFLESGRFDELGWGDDELALACASHGGEPEHVRLAASMLAKVGLEEGDLACGPHEPLSRRGARMHQQAGGRLTRLHNNCSGKHAAMLAFARTSGWPVLGYEKSDHPVQQHALARVADWSDVPREEVRVAVDGCGVSAFGLPLDAMARAFAKLGAAAVRGEEMASRIMAAMTSKPHLVGGTDRFDTVLMEETAGSLLAKVGAEGVHCVAIPGESLGLAIKVEDGSTRAQHPATLRLLQHLGALPDTLPARLASFLRVPIQNTRGEIVGAVHPVS